ncbi:MAG: hypothetical protein ACRELB_17415 [Polyangiaceae bacterium]
MSRTGSMAPGGGWFGVLVAAGGVLAGCHPAGDAGGGDCASAGGECVVGDVICAVPGPQSCGPPSPGGVYCCLSRVADCGQPAEITTVCPAAPDGGAVCRGSAPVPLGAPGYEALQEAGDVDASFAVGCTVTFPVCNAGRPPSCTCSTQGSATWSCVY